ncbi:MAG: exosortase/archaeosortase family protein [Phycisphaeraceae bacterium]
MSSTASVTSLTSTAASRPLVTREGWLWIAIVGGLFALFHQHFLYRTWLFASTDDNWSHALIVPLISLYFIYQQRQRLMATPRKVAVTGLPILLAGLVGYAFWIFPGRVDMFQGYSMILALFGLTIFMLGWRMIAVLWLPILYLGFAVKVADKLWEWVAFQLQQVAAVGATFALKFFTTVFDFDVAYQGSTIELQFWQNGHWVAEKLNVAEACAGLRMLMAFLALGVALAFIWDRAWWQRLIMVGMAVPIAVFVNMGRVTALGLLFLVNPEYARGDFHIFVGMLMLIPAALIFLALGWVLENIFIRDPDAPGPVDAEVAAPHAPPEHSDEPREARAGAIGRGLAMGIALVALVGLTYVLALGTIRPDIGLGGLSPAAAGTLLVVCVLALVAAVPLIRRLLPAAATSRQFTVAAAMAAGVLGAALAGQQSAIALTQAVLIKEPVPLRHRMMLFPERVGTWELWREDPPLSKDLVAELGTDQYLSRIYRDRAWPESEPGSIVRLHVAYYTGTPDTVPHVPDRCFVAAGMEYVGRSGRVLELTSPQLEPDPESDNYLHPATLESMVRIPDKRINTTQFAFARPERPGAREHVLYFFAANGRFMATPEQVRIDGFDPRDRYSYYAKIEIQVLGVADEELAAERARDMLDAALPELMAMLPDWVEVQRGQWPVQPDAAGQTLTD